MSKQQIILQIMDGARRLGIRPSDILGKGTNIFRFPKQGDINPFDPNMLVAMKQFGQDSVTKAKEKLADGLRYLTTENEMNLTNYLNNLNDFLRMGKGQEPIKEGLAGTKTADVFDIQNKKLLTGKEKETLEQTQGLAPGVDPESTMGQIQNIGRGLEEFLDQVQGIDPATRRKLNQEKINQVIKQVTDVGGSMDDARDLLSKTTSLDILLEQTLPRYVKAKNLGAKTKPEIEMIEEAEDSFDVYKDRPEKLEEHFKEFYTPRLIISRIEDSIAENLRQTGKFTDDEIDNLTIYGNVDKSNPIKYLEDMKETLGDVDYDLDTTVYKNYADEYIYGTEKYNERVKGIKPKVDDEDFDLEKGLNDLDEFNVTKDAARAKKILDDLDDEEPFANGGRVGFSLGGGVKGKAIQGILNLIRSKYGQEAIDTLENLYSSGKLKLNDIKKQFLEDREAVKGFEKRQNKTRELTDEEYEDFVEELGGEDYLESYNFDGTVGDAERILKEQKDYENYMYDQYKTGKLDPQPGDTGRERFKYLQNQMEEMEMSGDKRLMTRDEIEELIDLEKRYEYLDLLEKAQDTTRKLTSEEISQLKEFDDMGYANVLKAMDKINKKAKGGLI
jgi:hypothetical protein